MTARGATHKVKHYYGCGNAPSSLFELESSMDKTVNSQQWTGDVREAGPLPSERLAGEIDLLSLELLDAFEEDVTYDG